MLTLNTCYEIICYFFFFKFFYTVYQYSLLFFFLISFLFSYFFSLQWDAVAVATVRVFAVSTARMHCVFTSSPLLFLCLFKVFVCFSWQHGIDQFPWVLSCLSCCTTHRTLDYTDARYFSWFSTRCNLMSSWLVRELLWCVLRRVTYWTISSVLRFLSPRVALWWGVASLSPLFLWAGAWLSCVPSRFRLLDPLWCRLAAVVLFLALRIFFFIGCVGFGGFLILYYAASFEVFRVVCVLEYFSVFWNYIHIFFRFTYNFEWSIIPCV